MSQGPARATLGRTGLRVSPLCIGTAAWGDASPDHGARVAERDAIDAALRTFAGPLNFLDTSNNYGAGMAERRIGTAIAEAGGLPEGFVLQTKVDRDPVTGSFSAHRLRASLEESLERLGLDSVPILMLHDPEHLGFDAAMAPGGAVETTVALRDEGYCEWIGVGGAPVSMLRDFVRTDIFDVVLTHNRYTLLDRTAAPLLDDARDRHVGVLNGAVFAGGVLAQWPDHRGLYAYGQASPEILSAIDAMGQACQRHGVTLLEAALQFSMRDESIASTVCGVENAAQIDGLLEAADRPIPAQLWDELEALVPPAHTWRGD